MRKIPHWLETYEDAESIDLLRTLALSHAEAIGDKGSEVAKLIKQGNLRALCEFEVDYTSLGSSWEAAHLRQALAFFQKNEGLDIGYDREVEARKKFTAAETLCRETNEVVRAWHQGRASLPPRIASRFAEAQWLIANVLGPCPSWEQLGYRFGKGATTLTRKRMASLREKFKAGLSCSEDLLPAATAVLGELPMLCEAWADFFVRDGYDAVVDGKEAHVTEFLASVPIVIHDAVLEFVPKNAKTFRSIATEPVLNGLVQMAIGDLMVERLARVGVDLKDQGLNQELARTGSLTGDLATLDLSSASDTVSRELVGSLLPLDWFTLLNRARSGHMWDRSKGDRIHLQKFSSMGNGFTFPLESLIFWALCRVVCDESDTVSVYGDDLIIPTAKYADVVETLQYAGFVVNKQKSYSTGPFRESCGADWYLGTQIRPFYQKEGVSPRSLFVLHNFYVRKGDRGRARLVHDWIHPALRIYGPDGYGDGHLLGDFQRKRKDSFIRKGWGGYTFDTFVVNGRQDLSPLKRGDFVVPSYTVYQRSAEPVVKRATLLGPDRAGDYASFLRIFRREVALSVTPLGVNVDGGPGTSFPVADKQYRRLSVYTF